MLRPSATQLTKLILPLLLAGSVAAQESFPFRSVPMRGVTALRSANEILQDRQGLIWLATEQGVFYFDGREATPVDLGLPPGGGVEVETIFQDSRGDLWVGTFGSGLVKLDGRTLAPTWLPAAPQGPLPHGEVYSVAEDHDGSILIGTQVGLARLGRDGALLERWGFESDGDGGSVLNIAADGEGGFWLGTRRGLYRWSAGDDAPRAVGATLPDGTPFEALTIWQVLVEPDGIWLGTDVRGLVHLSMDGAVRQYDHDPRDPDSLSNNTVYTLLRSADGLLWVGTYQGLGTLDADGRFLHHRRERGRDDTLVGDTVYALIEDRSGLVWIGTAGGGVGQHDPYARRFEIYGPDLQGEVGASLGDVVDMELRADDRIWVATLDGGLSLLDADTGELVRQIGFGPAPGGLRSGTVVSVEGAGEDAVWVGTTLSVEHVDADGRVTPIEHPSLPSGEAWAVLEDRLGGLWVGLYGDALYHRPPGSEAFQLFTGVDANGQAMDVRYNLVHQSTDGTIWVGTNGGGLYALDLDGGPLTRYDFNIGGGDHALETIYAVADDSAGNLWVGTGGGGLVRLDPSTGSRRIYTRADGLSDDLIVGIHLDSEGIWVTTFSGVARMRPGDSRFQVLPVGRGMDDSQFNEGAVLRLGDGRMLFGGREGVLSFDPDQLQADPVPPIPVVMSAHVGNHELVPKRLDPDSSLVGPPFLLDELVLPRGDDSVTLELAALHYSAPPLNRIRYRLDGVDESWIQLRSDQARAVLSDLLPGTYELVIAAANPDGVWSAERRIPLVVRPSVWLHPAALISYLVLGVALLAFILDRRRRLSERHRAEVARLRLEQERLRLALWGSDNFLWEWQLDERDMYASGLLEHLGYPEGDGIILREWMEENLHREDLGELLKIAKRLREGRAQEVELHFRARAADGEWHWLQGKGRLVYDLEQRPLRATGACKDVTSTYLTQSDLQLAQLATETSLDAVCVLDEDFDFLRVNRAFTDITGYASEEVIGRNASLLSSDRYPSSFVENMRRSLKEWGSWRGELWERDKDGGDFLSWLRVTRVEDERTGRTMFVAVFTDITQRHRSEEELRYLANYDSLTGLPNRTLLMDRLTQALGRAERRNERMALLRLDLDHFKDINDAGGQLQGDRVLKAVGDVMSQRAGEVGTAARLAADEFVLLLPGLPDEAMLARYIEELAESVAGLPVGGTLAHRLSFSCGVAIYPDDALDADQLLQRADLALQQAKREGPGVWRSYHAALDEGLRERVSMASALTKALGSEALELHFQPKVDGRTEQVTGLEALLRWRDEEQGLIPPSRFIPLAEERGLIHELGKQALISVCETIRKLRAEGLRPVPIALNLSALQAEDTSLPRAVAGVLEEYGVDAQLLQFELTESSLMSASGQGMRVLEDLRDLGIKLAVDDFGTGYSSLNYLRRLPVDGIKVDRSFVMDLGEDRFAEGIARAIVAMAQSLDLEVTAEGVETQAQLDFMLSIGCREIQGYLFSRPLSYDKLTAFLRAAPAAPTDGQDQGSA